MYQQAETNRLRRLSMYVSAVAKTAAKLPLPQPEEGVKEDTIRAPERVQTVEKRKKLQWKLSREHTGVCKKESQKSLEKEKKAKEKKEKEKRKKESPATKEREQKEKTKERVKEKKERAKTKERRAKASPKEMEKRKRREKERKKCKGGTGQKANIPGGVRWWRMGSSVEASERKEQVSKEQGDAKEGACKATSEEASRAYEGSSKGFSAGPRRGAKISTAAGYGTNYATGHHGVPSRKSTPSTLTRQPAEPSRCLHRHGR